MNIYVEKGAYVPNRAHKTDAGLDIRSRETRLVKAHSLCDSLDENTERGDKGFGSSGK